jgi:hypothetical protein
MIDKDHHFGILDEMTQQHEVTNDLKVEFATE